jgi:hypothetical protein
MKPRLGSIQSERFDHANVGKAFRRATAKNQRNGWFFNYRRLRRDFRLGRLGCAGTDKQCQAHYQGRRAAR